MRKTFLAMLLCLPLTAFGDYMDVIQVKLVDGCTFDTYMQITSDFNKWGEKNGYLARVAMPLQNEDLTTFYWLGESENAAAFGKAWDTWRDAQSDPDSTPAKLWARFQACSVNLGRWGYDLY